MQVHRDIKNLPDFKNAVITIGTFDGVHTGHLRIIQQLKKEATAIGGETVIITFHPHPRMVLNAALGKSSHAIKLLNTLTEKIELLENCGIDHLVVVPFTIDFSEQSAEEYIREFLVSTFRPHTIIIGYDHHFGKDRLGDYKLLESYQEEFKFKVLEIPEHVLHDITISSTRIRHALENSDIATANEYLGYAYFFEGTVVGGDKLGRQIGYPTANIDVTEKNKLVPGNGVYAVKLCLMEEVKNEKGIVHYLPKSTVFNGMMNIGVRPTVGGTQRMIEINIFDFAETIYGEITRIYVKHFLRDEVKFDGLDALKDQLAKDKQDASNCLEK